MPQEAVNHTPAPWLVISDTGYILGPHIGLARREIGRVKIRKGDPQSLADKALIEAAPKLLEQLTNLVGLAEKRGRLEEYVAALKDAREVIALAKGR